VNGESTMERAQFLLAMRATEPQTAAEARELADLLALHPEIDSDSYDLAAAALLAESLTAEPLPAALRQRLIAEGERLVAGQGGNAVVPFRRSERSQPDSSRLGWLAAAACLLLALASWWPRLASAPTPSPQSAAATELTAAEQRAELLSAGSDVRLVPWAATEDPAAVGASGDVVWSPSQQRGFMRISRLEANVATASQYQLWIFDRQRDERYPVDGGVFDMPAGAAEVVVPIDAKIMVAEPYLFAVTVEKPGGVVVSDRERIVLVAQAAA